MLTRPNLSNGKIKVPFSSTGTYTITAAIGSVVTESITVNVVDYIIIINQSPKMILPGSECDFTAASDYPNPTYIWTVKKESADVPYTRVSNDKIKVIFSSEGRYTITAKIDAIATKTITVIVDDVSIFYISPDDDPLVANKTYTLTPKISTDFITGLKLYDLERGTEIQPDFLNYTMAYITFPQSSTYRIEVKITDLSGKVITGIKDVQVQ